MTKENVKRIMKLDGLIAEGEFKLANVKALQDRLGSGSSCGRLSVGAIDVTIENPALLKCLVDITSVSFKAQLAKLEKELEEL